MEVALLVKDLQQAKELSLALRHWGLVAAVFKTLDDFWAQSLVKSFDLLIADVALMSSGEKRLIDHPHLSSQQLHCAFYYDQDCLPLLQSTLEFPHMGLVKKSPSDRHYKEELRAILHRVEKFIELKDENKSLIQERNQWENRNEESWKKLRTSQKFHEASILAKEWLLFLEKKLPQMGMAKALGALLEERLEIKNYMLLELSENRQKIISVETKGAKFCHIPSLWPAGSCQQGMDSATMTMIAQVGAEVIGPKAIGLFLKGPMVRPSLALVFETDVSIPEQWPWDEVQLALEGLYCRYCLLQTNSSLEVQKVNLKNEQTSWLQTWEMADFLEAAFEDEKAYEQHMLLNIDFTSLVKLIELRPRERFCWKAMAYDMKDKLKHLVGAKSYFTFYSLEHLVLVVELEKSERRNQIFNAVKDFSKNYPYYRFFENPDALLAKDIDVKVRTSQLSLAAYRKLMKETQLQTHAQDNSLGNDVTKNSYTKHLPVRNEVEL